MASDEGHNGVINLHFLSFRIFKYFRQGSTILFNGIVLSAKLINFFNVSSSKLAGKHSEYSHWKIGVNINAGSVCRTAIGVNGDDGGVSKNPDNNGLRARYGDNGGRPRGTDVGVVAVDDALCRL